MRTIAALILVMSIGNVGLTQNPQNVLVGVWERTLLRDIQGRTLQPPAPAAVVMFSSNGYFSHVAIPSKRQKLQEDVRGMTKDELMSRFEHLESRYGTYKVEGNKLRRLDITNADPSREGGVSVSLFRIEKDVLILSTTDGVDTTWFKRLK